MDPTPYAMDLDRPELAPVRRLADSLRTLHRSLLVAARQEYEQTHGPVDTPARLLHLATSHPSFAFLRPLSELMVDLDTELDEGGSPATVLAAALREELSELLGLLPGGPGRPGFTARYRELMQLDPEVVLAHSRIRAVIRSLPERSAEADLAEVLHERHRWAEKQKFRKDVLAAGTPPLAPREARDAVEQASIDSFPASDPPGWIHRGPGQVL